MIEKKWVVEHGIGHWEVSDGLHTISCDEDELNAAISELRRL